MMSGSTLQAEFNLVNNIHCSLITDYANCCLQFLLQTAHDVEARKVKEFEKLNRQVRLLTSEEAANLVSTLHQKLLFVDNNH